jgi:MFS family permease
MKDRFNIFHGWWIVIIGTVSILIVGGIVWNSFGAFFIPLIDEFGWSRGQLSWAMFISALVLIPSPFIGALVDKYGSRRIMILGTIVTGVCFTLLGLTGSIGYFYALYLATTIGLLGIVDIPVVVAVTNWFDKRRGLAMGIVISGWGMGGLLITPLATYFISSLGWRNTYYVLGLGMMIVLVPLIATAFRHRPEEKGLLPYGRGVRTSDFFSEVKHTNQPEFTFAGAIKTRNFWLLTSVIASAVLVVSSIVTHLMPFLQDIGLSPQTAANIAAATAGISVPSGLLIGYLADRFSMKLLLIITLVLEASGIAVLLITDSVSIALMFVVLFGLAMGAPFTLLPLLIPKLFGFNSMGAIYGGVWAVVSVAFAIGPLLTGYIFDVTGSYNFAFMLFIAIILIAVLIAYFIKLRETL